jgi:hypothetical protein
VIADVVLSLLNLNPKVFARLQRLSSHVNCNLQGGFYFIDRILAFGLKVGHALVHIIQLRVVVIPHSVLRKN